MSLYSEVIPENRVLSIDALRGFDMFWIIGGGAFLRNLLEAIGTPFNQVIFSQMHHAEWHGFTTWDLIFPLFLFIMGASMPFSLSRRVERGELHKSIYLHIVKRALILYFFGMIIEAGRISSFGGLRYTGVLHRIAFCYLFASLIVVNTSVIGQALWAGFLLLFYWIVMTFIPIPGYEAGVLTPEGNLASYIDRLFLPGVLYHDIFDNEGILSTVPAVSTTLLGVLSGHWLRSSFTPGRKCAGLCAAGVLSLMLGLLWNTVFPINKLLWTSSYVLYSGGWSLLLLGGFYLLIDVRGYRVWAFPLVVIGLNPITIYMAGSLFDFGRIVSIFTYEFADSLKSLQPLFRASSILLVKWLFLYYLYRKKIFLRV
ncbi:MAG: DUF5009 domain-containing protein [Candidatus Latescibacteria bacterium]|jgi:predicted acyltransferase|nr:DUF5009 domain-containing protein [Candidatus Latescibacterota bacterium]